MMTPDELDARFTYHCPTVEQAKKYTSIRRRARAFAEVIDVACPDSREKSLAITKLEEAMMWANAAIARREELTHD